MVRQAPKSIEEVFVFVAQDEHGGEGVMAFQTIPTGNWMPMVAGDAERVRSMVRVADQISAATGTSYEIRRFRHGRDVTAQFKEQA